MKKILLSIAAATLLISQAAGAAVLKTTELPSNAYITVGKYDIAWISPLSQGSADFLGAVGVRLGAHDSRRLQ